jgi:hypothetical protein
VDRHRRSTQLGTCSAEDALDEGDRLGVLVAERRLPGWPGSRLVLVVSKLLRDIGQPVPLGGFVVERGNVDHGP